ncbi:MAG: autotransporter domain-containing protein, partial [Fusobacteriaceae bacterium]|nr:autotransporter domain-containing protein [Fusobacteriaceae bacterium]
RQIGGGILGRLNFNEHESNEWYLKGSLHTGQIKNQYDSRDLRDLAGTVASYDKSSWYLGGHAELGTTWELSDKTKLGLGGKFLFSVIESGTVHLATGDPIDFRHMISERGQLAFSAQHKISDRVIPYARLSAEYEWKGEALATTHGYSLPAPSLHGASAGIELGIIAEPTEKMPLSIQTGIVGLYGKKEGYLGQLKIKYTL